jgi:hypothetical protein
MSLILDGTNGVSDIDGTAATPAIRGTDANTGIFFPAADTIAFSEGGAESMRINSAGNLGIGTTNPINKLDIQTSASTTVRLTGGNSSNQGSGYFIANTAQTQTLLALSDDSQINGGTPETLMSVYSNKPLLFYSNAVERMRITSGGSLCVNNTTSAGGQPLYVRAFSGTGSAGFQVFANGNGAIDWYNGSAGYVASVIVNASSVAYNTTSDYRLKENIVPMTGALDKVAQLKPVTYDWKAGGSSQGFIAHELAEVVPDCVTGEKDAIGEDEKPRYQGVDTSFLVATLTAAIQELNAKVDAQAARIAALEEAAV